ncbi:dihydrofolate reductase family protein [Microbacterium suwonense]|uniref:Bacterial bifunctional deaminase-reductase C-terminal domain-containing protein n=1 Tax=Microbacterium suwonense TaxID=683047 RepID=A0ABM8FSR2_9MICO|nr:hypothetical protein GCM10025863_11620 [Microbacterium suwonense]
MTTHYYTASSLDGFIATADHSLDWLLTQDIDEDGPMAYSGFRAGLGAMAMGAHTYEWILEHDEDGWSYTLPAWVFSHRRLNLPDGADIRLTRDDVRKVHAEMSAVAGDKDLWIVGEGNSSASSPMPGSSTRCGSSTRPSRWDPVLRCCRASWTSSSWTSRATGRSSAGATGCSALNRLVPWSHSPRGTEPETTSSSSKMRTARSI